MASAVISLSPLKEPSEVFKTQENKCDTVLLQATLYNIGISDFDSDFEIAQSFHTFMYDRHNLSEQIQAVKSTNELLARKNKNYFVRIAYQGNEIKVGSNSNTAYFQLINLNELDDKCFATPCYESPTTYLPFICSPKDDTEYKLVSADDPWDIPHSTLMAFNPRLANLLQKKTDNLTGKFESRNDTSRVKDTKLKSNESSEKESVPQIKQTQVTPSKPYQERPLPSNPLTSSIMLSENKTQKCTNKVVQAPHSTPNAQHKKVHVVAVPNRSGTGVTLVSQPRAINIHEHSSKHQKKPIKERVFAPSKKTSELNKPVVYPKATISSNKKPQPPKSLSQFISDNNNFLMFSPLQKAVVKNCLLLFQILYQSNETPKLAETATFAQYLAAIHLSKNKPTQVIDILLEQLNDLSEKVPLDQQETLRMVIAKIKNALTIKVSPFLPNIAADILPPPIKRPKFN
ncbi:hypothetical protein D5R81_09510 [Parashewanella spongiae]|uniref:Uncharacterized protein n=2 Tax=Parashewanella spongiae TaxID=342950 RepID=A0A3A6U4Q3_9GAMM|nr:hypothetical protein [Parashewanella spongiae]MCL1078128.1 hypothetical protein [Parashewanella spongiae]RJY16374.1 hypothetical protein D5R81_09510 [Parashewanella spongiae]